MLRCDKGAVSVTIHDTALGERTLFSSTVAMISDPCRRAEEEKSELKRRGTQNPRLPQVISKVLAAGTVALPRRYGTPRLYAAKRHDQRSFRHASVNRFRNPTVRSVTDRKSDRRLRNGLAEELRRRRR